MKKFVFLSVLTMLLTVCFVPPPGVAMTVDQQTEETLFTNPGLDAAFDVAVLDVIEVAPDISLVIGSVENGNVLMPLVGLPYEPEINISDYATNITDLCWFSNIRFYNEPLANSDKYRYKRSCQNNTSTEIAYGCDIGFVKQRDRYIGIKTSPA